LPGVRCTGCPRRDGDAGRDDRGELAGPRLDQVDAVYYAMLATPLGIGDIVVGHQLWMATRVATSSAVYLAVIAAFGGIQSPLAVLALPACVLIGVAFAGPMAAYAATRERDGAFVPVMRFGIVPMFLFSGTFFPISRLPVVLEWVARATPLWHGVDLCRGLTLGTITWS